MFHVTELSRPVPRPGRVIPRGNMSDLLSRIATDRSDEAFRELFEDFGPRIRSYMLRQGADARGGGAGAGDAADGMAQGRRSTRLTRARHDLDLHDCAQSADRPAAPGDAVAGADGGACRIHPLR